MGWRLDASPPLDPLVVARERSRPPTPRRNALLAETRADAAACNIAAMRVERRLSSACWRHCGPGIRETRTKSADMATNWTGPRMGHAGDRRGVPGLRSEARPRVPAGHDRAAGGGDRRRAPRPGPPQLVRFGCRGRRPVRHPLVAHRRGHRNGTHSLLARLAISVGLTAVVLAKRDRQGAREAGADARNLRRRAALAAVGRLTARTVESGHERRSGRWRVGRSGPTCRRWFGTPGGAVAMH